MTQALWNAAGVVGILAIVGGVTVLVFVVRDNWRRHEAALDALLADAREKSDVSATPIFDNLAVEALYADMAEFGGER